MHNFSLKEGLYSTTLEFSMLVDEEFDEADIFTETERGLCLLADISPSCINHL
jgi:hypothetical protein